MNLFTSARSETLIVELSGKICSGLQQRKDVSSKRQKRKGNTMTDSFLTHRGHYSCCCCCSCLLICSPSRLPSIVELSPLLFSFRNGVSVSSVDCRLSCLIDRPFSFLPVPSPSFFLRSPVSILLQLFCHNHVLSSPSPLFCNSAFAWLSAILLPQYTCCSACNQHALPLRATDTFKLHSTDVSHSSKCRYYEDIDELFQTNSLQSDLWRQPFSFIPLSTASPTGQAMSPHSIRHIPDRGSTGEDLLACI